MRGKRRRIMAITERSVVVGVFADRAAAEQAVHELQQAGFSDDQIKYSINKGGPGILGSLVGMGLPHDEASFYNNEFQSGRTVIAVKTNDQQQEASDILRLSGAYDANTRFSDGRSSNERTGNDQSLQLREEVLQVQKQWVQSGEFRIRKRVITEEKTFTVPISREEVIIEHIPTNSQSSNAPAGQEPSSAAGEGKVVQLGPDETIKILVREEQVTIEKRPMVIEEITLTKRVLQEMKEIKGNVQREEVRLERRGKVHIQGDNLDDVPLRSSQEE